MYEQDEISSKRNVDEQIKYILDEFDFDSVHIVLKALGYTWDINDDGILVVPTAVQLKEYAKELLIRLTSNKPKITSIQSGGFYAAKCDDYFSISYTLEEVNSLCWNQDKYQEFKDYPMRTKYLRGDYE